MMLILITSSQVPTNETTRIHGYYNNDAELGGWTGIMGYSSDGAPWVGAVPDLPPGLWIPAGFTGHGMPNAPLSAQYVARLILDELMFSSSGQFDFDRDHSRLLGLLGAEKMKLFHKAISSRRRGWIGLSPIISNSNI